MTHEELITSQEYIIAKIQIDLFNQVKNYMAENNLNQTQFAQKLGVSKGYISQVLNGDFDHRISKMVELALAVGVIPSVKFQNKDSYVLNDVVSSEEVSKDEIDSCREFLHRKGYITCQVKPELNKQDSCSDAIIAA